VLAHGAERFDVGLIPAQAVDFGAEGSTCEREHGRQKENQYLLHNPAGSPFFYRREFPIFGFG